jgi:metal-responsive CopG/Arc/MetJ family transcriptional regulator
MQQIAIRLPIEMLEQIEEIVAERYGQADRTAVIRELIAAQLAARSKRK